mmetsp:Transcript_28006/g.96818  ORF Transcript_28006/g.96818 Transcript_28006/m.96818 type:complete len:244 (+) Transcript_28006:775-1506(+)
MHGHLPRGDRHAAVVVDVVDGVLRRPAQRPGRAHRGVLGPGAGDGGKRLRRRARHTAAAPRAHRARLQAEPLLRHHPPAAGGDHVVDAVAGAAALLRLRHHRALLVGHVLHRGRRPARRAVQGARAARQPLHLHTGHGVLVRRHRDLHRLRRHLPAHRRGPHGGRDGRRRRQRRRRDAALRHLHALPQGDAHAGEGDRGEARAHGLHVRAGPAEPRGVDARAAAGQRGGAARAAAALDGVGRA